MHVLGTPPAFVLSQDQTLQFEHLPRSATSVTVRSETGHEHAHLTGEPVAYSAFKEQDRLCRTTGDSESPGGFCATAQGLAPRESRQKLMLVDPPRPCQGLFPDNAGGGS